MEKTHTKIDVDKEYLEEIISILAMHGRPDLISILKDTEYKPPKRVKKEYYSDDEGSAVSESDYEVDIDEDGFQSLK
tara:strand:+ start:3586 stop:3816 length:231 start_codon:yes stop_codon:yes gene_type:complete